MITPRRSYGTQSTAAAVPARGARPALAAPSAPHASLVATPPTPDLDDHIEAVQLAIADARDTAEVARAMLTATLAGATVGGVTLTLAEARGLIYLAGHVVERVAAVDAATGSLVLSRLQ